MRFGELGEVTAAVEALFFAGDGEEDDGAGEFEFGEDAGGLDGDGGAAGVIVGAGCGVVGVVVGGVAGVVVAGDEDDATGLRGIGAAKDGVDVGELGGFGDARGRSGTAGLDELVAFDFEASAAGFGVALEFGLDPVGCGVDAGAGRKVGVHAGECAAIFEADEFGDGGFDLIGRDLRERLCDGGIGGGGRDGLADCGGCGRASGKGLLRVEKADGEQGGSGDNVPEVSEEAGAGVHGISPC